MGPDIPEGPSTGTTTTTPSTDGEVVEEPKETPVLNVKQTEDIEYIKNFLLNYTNCIVQYIEENKLYYSYKLADFYLEVSDTYKLYKRKYNSSGDYELRETYETNILINLINSVLNDTNKLEFLG